jgi:hypothetical protein
MYILYIAQWFFSLHMSSGLAKGVLDPQLPWADTFAVRLRQTVDLVHVLTTVKGLLLLVPPRTPRSSGYDVYAHTVYVVICYMSLTCICLCLVLAASCYMYMSVVCCYMLYVSYMLYVCYMSSLGGVVRVRLYS